MNYARGDVVEFHQNAVGFREGRAPGIGKASVPLKAAGSFQVYRASI